MAYTLKSIVDAVNQHGLWRLDVVIGAFGILIFIRTIYRLYFHPLRKIPGPRLAAATHLVEFYYDVIKGGMYLWEIERMHQKYGPIVRINPRQIHIIDPDFYEEIYAGGNRKRDKDPAFPPRLGMSLSVISTVPHDLHRLRRKILNNFFSKKSVTSLEPIMQDKVDKLASRLQQACELGTTVKLEYAFAALTADVISHYCYGDSFGYLEEKWPNNDLKDAFEGLFLGIHVLYFFPLLGSMMKSLPPWLMAKLDPKSGPVAYFRSFARKRSVDALEKAHDKTPDQERTIFDALVDPALPAQERTVDRLTEEGMIVLGAGAETTASTLVCGAFHLIKNPSVLSKLREELKNTVMPHPNSSPTWNQLEQLPYMTAVINEILRLAIGGSWRMPRMATTETLIYQNYEIPPGTPMITCSYFVQMNPDIFPDPFAFDPERWIRAAEKGENLTRYITNFAKGSRNCLGINLAYAELYLVIARFARQFDYDLYETTENDIAYSRDYAIFHSDKGAWSVKVKVQKVLEE